MDALTALHTRTSSPRLSEPAPSGTVLENIYKAAFRAADHGLLQPWRFLEVRGDARARLGDLLVTAALSDDPELSEAQQEKIRCKPSRAPLLIITIASKKDHPKVPEFEQDLSAAAATQNMLIACHAQGVGVMWRTGALAYHPIVKEGLGLQAHEKIIGILYLGTHEGPTRTLSTPNLSDFVQDW
ncbi:MAG: nitroreductase family protein [Pseudomonadales bacterium]|nr:nitroreductase family protein [Pseudomonadales bacterium]